jgi:UDP-glucose 4-epimerase
LKVVVTGGAGFLGGHVVARLAADGLDVTSLDMRDHSHPGARSTVVDLLDAAALGRAVRGSDVICHIGAIGDVYLAGEQPALAAAVNVTGTANVAEAAARHGARVVYASTWEVYGEPRYEPVDERHPCSPDHPYNITKLAGEQLLLAADRLRGVPVIALRLGTAYGPGLRPNSVFRIFIDRARRGEPITIQGDGAQGRQFTHASDIARAFSLAARTDVRAMPLNIVASRSVSIKELAELVIARYPTELFFAAARPGDVPPSIVSSKKALDLMGWEAVTPFEDGLADLMASLDEG